MDNHFKLYEEFLNEAENLTKEQVQMQMEKIEPWAKSTGAAYEIENSGLGQSIFLRSKYGYSRLSYDEVMKKGNNDNRSHSYNYTRSKQKTWYMTFCQAFNRYDVNANVKRASPVTFMKSFDIMLEVEKKYDQAIKFLEIVGFKLEFIPKPQTNWFQWDAKSASEFSLYVRFSPGKMMGFKTKKGECLYSMTNLTKRDSQYKMPAMLEVDGKTVEFLLALYLISDIGDKYIETYLKLHAMDPLDEFMDKLEKEGLEKMLHTERGKISTEKFF